MSKQKELLYSIVTAAPRHLTAEEIHAIARQEMPTLALGTVYRNLGQLTAEGRIGRVEMPCDAPARYDRDSRSHPHLVCERCGHVDDLVMPGGLLTPLLEPLDIRCTGFDLKIYHICPACAGED